MARTFVIPMQAPKNGTGKGIMGRDQWRPKYLQEMGLGHEMVGNARGFCVTKVKGPDPIIDQLAQRPEVVEIFDDLRITTSEVRGKVDTLCNLAGVSIAGNSTHKEMLTSLRAAILFKQMREPPSILIAQELISRIGRG